MTQANRTFDIATILQGIASKAFQASADTQSVKDANKASLTKAVDGEISVRDALMVEIAMASAAGNWSEIEISNAGSKVVAAFNNPDKAAKKSFQSLVSEFKAAMHPYARDYVGDLIALRDAAMNDEAEMLSGDTSYSAPIKAAWSNRKYHILNALIGEAKNFGRVYTTVQEVIDFARHCDPAYDPKKLKTRLDSIKKVVDAFISDCNVSALTDVSQTLAGISEKDISEGMTARPAKPVLEFQHPSYITPNAPKIAPKVPTQAPKLTVAPKQNPPAPPAKGAAKTEVTNDTVSQLDQLVA